MPKKIKNQKKEKKQQKKQKYNNVIPEDAIILKEPKKDSFGIVEDNSKFVEAEKKREEGVHRTLNNFISTVSKSKIGVVIPLYGYWTGIKDNQLDLDVLKTVVNRVYSQSHELFIVFVAEEKRLPSDIVNYIGVNSFSGNSMGVSVPKGACYSEYIKEGINNAIDRGAKYIIIINPWVIIQENAIDEMANRLNKQDVAIVSGFDIRGKINPESFDSFSVSFPKENRNIDINFLGMSRYCADVMNIDLNIKTPMFTKIDMWQTLNRKGFECIISQNIPIYSFEIDWSEIDNEEVIEGDKSEFTKKWGFIPN